MKFHIQDVAPDTIVGWVVPDNPRAASRVCVVADGRRVAEVDATVVVADLKNWGWHETGCCFFIVNEESAPGVAGARRVEIYESSTNILIYRTAYRPDLVQKKLFLLETDTHPWIELSQSLFGAFQIQYFRIGELNFDTLLFAFNTVLTKSLLFSGRILYQRYESILYKQEFLKAVAIKDPLLDMAERLLWLRAQARRGAALADASGGDWRNLHIAPAVAFAEGLDLEDPRALRRAFRDIDAGAHALLSNPLLRHLCTHAPGEAIGGFHSNLALETLSRFQVVGHRDYPEAFHASLAAALEVDLPPIRPTAPEPEAAALADALSRLPPARDLVAPDIELSDVVRGLVDRHWAA